MENTTFLFDYTMPEIGDFITNPDWWAASFPSQVEWPYDQLHADFQNPSVELTAPPPLPQPHDHHCVDFADLTADQEWAADSCLLDAIDVGNTVVEPPPVNSHSKMPQEHCVDGDDLVSTLLDLIDFDTDQELGDSCNLPPFVNEGLDRDFNVDKGLAGMTELSIPPPASLVEAASLSTKAPRPSPEFQPIKTVPLSNSGRVRKRNTWTEEEHRLFLKGIEVCGDSNWKSISEHYVKTRTHIQIASHAQKYYSRRKLDATRKRRKSIHDIVIDN